MPCQYDPEYEAYLSNQERDKAMAHAEAADQHCRSLEESVDELEYQVYCLQEERTVLRRAIRRAIEILTAVLE